MASEEIRLSSQLRVQKRAATSCRENRERTKRCDLKYNIIIIVELEQYLFYSGYLPTRRGLRSR